MVVLCTAQLDNQSWSLLISAECSVAHFSLEYLERPQFQAYIYKWVNCPLNYDVSNYVYNVPVNFDQIHSTLLSVVYLKLASNPCLRLDQIPSPH